MIRPLTLLIIGLPESGKTTLRNYLTSLGDVFAAGASCSDVLIDDLAERTCVSREMIVANKDALRPELVRMGDEYTKENPAALAIAAYERYCARAPVLRVLDGIRRQHELTEMLSYLASRFDLANGREDAAVIWVNRHDRPDISDNTTVQITDSHLIADRLPGFLVGEPPSFFTLVESIRAISSFPFTPSVTFGFPCGEYYFRLTPQKERRRPPSSPKSTRKQTYHS